MKHLFELDEHSGCRAMTKNVFVTKKENETIQMFDTIHNKFRDINDIYDEISFVKFLQYWLHSSLIFPAIWFLKKVKDKKITKGKNRTLEESWQLKKK